MCGKNVNEGEEVHASVVRTGFASSEFVSGAFLGFYVANGFISQARQVFDEMPQPGLVLWTLMIRAYDCLKTTVVWNTMIHQSLEHNNLDPGKQLFNSMPERDVASWNSIIRGFANPRKHWHCFMIWKFRFLDLVH